MFSSAPPADAKLTSQPVQKRKKPAPLELDVTCTSSDCERDLHCFKATARMKKEETVGRCRSCGADLVDWERVHQRKPGDVEHTVAALRREMIRHHFWHREIGQKALNHVLRKGRRGLHAAIRQRVKVSVGPSTDENAFDGRQTPMGPDANVIHLAQHAMAACCRNCIDYWHGIHKNRPLSDEEVEYLASLIDRYVEERLPDLSEEGVKVPPIRRERSVPEES